MCTIVNTHHVIDHYRLSVARLLLLLLLLTRSTQHIISLKLYLSLDLVTVYVTFQSQEHNILLKVFGIKHFGSDMHSSRMLSFSILWLFMLSMAPIYKGEWNEQSQQGLWELKEIGARRPNSSTWMDSPLLSMMESVGKSYFFDRLASPLLCLTICIPAQPSPIQFSAYPIILSMRRHFYPPIKTFKGPLSKRKECCFNSVVAPCLGPFFSVCTQPTLAAWLLFSSQCQAKRGPSHLLDIWQQPARTMSPLFTAPSTQSRL